jgi:hypothetical protein
MAYICKLNHFRECDGCMSCREEKEFYWHQFWTLIDLNLERWTSNVKI